MIFEDAIFSTHILKLSIFSAPFLLGLGVFQMRIFRLFGYFCIDSMAIPSSLSLLFFVGWFVYVVFFLSGLPLLYTPVYFSVLMKVFFSFLPIKKNHLKHLLTPFSRNAIKFYQFQMKGSPKVTFPVISAT